MISPRAEQLGGDAAAAARRRRPRGRPSLYALGEPLIWLTGGSLLACVAMIAGLLALVVYFGASTFWPLEVLKVTTRDGGVYLGEVTRHDSFKPDESVLAGLPPEAAARAREELAARGGKLARRLLRTGNFRFTNTHFEWVSQCMVREEARPIDAVVIEPLEWGRLYGYPEAFVFVSDYVDPRAADGSAKTLDQKKGEARLLAAALAPRYGGSARVVAKVSSEGADGMTIVAPEALDAALDIIGVAEVATGLDAAWPLFERFHGEVRKRWKVRRNLEKFETGDVNRREEDARLAVREAELELADAEADAGRASPAHAAAQGALAAATAEYERVGRWAAQEFAEIRRTIDALNRENGRYHLLLATAGFGRQPAHRFLVGLETVVRAYQPNKLSFGEKLGINLSRWWEYLTDEPREANSEGGVFPAIFGTVLMTLLMALAVVPFGVLASLYLREYARAGPIVSTVRIAVNNLAGVPSIVYGVFGLGFFCYGIGGFIDGGPTWQMPRGSWFLLLGGAAVVAFAAFLCLLGSLRRPGERVVLRQKLLRYVSILLWIACTLGVIALVATTPFYDGFYRARLPSPTFGKGALIWASFTLALMTLPVVIVATEEALASVPNSMREGSYACGAGKWQTIRRIVLPRATPGIMTGMILAMARGAGEVAPLMLVGAVKLAPELPFDASPPFGLNRSFMHLGFHIYDLAFQSQNAEAAKPMVYTTTLLLIALVAGLNLTAIWLRSRLRRRFVSDQF